MAFRFALETVLRLRRSLEDEERLRLQTLLARRASLENEVRDTGQAQVALKVALNHGLQQASLPGSELQFGAHRLRACELHTARLKAAASTLGQQIERQQSLLLRRRVERKVLEQLRDRQRARYECEVARREQAQIEELDLLRRAMRREQFSNRQLAVSIWHLAPRN